MFSDMIREMEPKFYLLSFTTSIILLGILHTLW